MSFSRKRIIYVDDVSFSLLSLKARMGSHYEMHPAQSAAEMFEILKHIIPDLILLDINMPEVDGYEALKQLKDDGNFARIPVILLTSQSDTDSLAKGMRLGAADYVIKPFPDEHLIERIELQLGAVRK